MKLDSSNPNVSFFEGLRSNLNRRAFLRRAGLAAALSPAAALVLNGGGEKASAAAAIPAGTELDLAILNFALNLEFLEAEYYTRGVTGQGLSSFGITLSGDGTQGTVTTKSSSTLVPFKSAVLQGYATEIAQDEQNHVKYIQSVISDLKGTPVAEPNIDLLNSFNTVAAKAGITQAGFDPFADEVSFFLGGYSLTDVGVTAYLGASRLITNKTVLIGSAGILAAEAYHDSTLRLSIFNSGTDAQMNAQSISDLRDSIDDNGKTDKDQGVANADGTPNIVPADSNSLAFARTTRQVLNIVYGGFKATEGLFFPTALNGPINS